MKMKVEKWSSMYDMKRVLLTGGSGFIGKNVTEYLGRSCRLLAPSRCELNLLDEQAVRDYLRSEQVDVVIHAANPNPVKNRLDKQETMFADSLRIFMNLYQVQDYYEQMYTLGSGAEYGKSEDISMITEEEAGRFVPEDLYGLAKYIISRLSEQSAKHCNLRIFACYGPKDHESKFITHAIRCCLEHRAITIRQDCFFDYMHVSDLAKILEYFIFKRPAYRAYNVCTGRRCTLKSIAKMIRSMMHTENKIEILKDGWNKEYTGSNQRLLSQMGGFQFMSLEEGIRLQIESETTGKSWK